MTGLAGRAQHSTRQIVWRVLAFAAVSGTGLVLDFVIFLLLVELGLRAGIANLVSAAVAVTFVYFASVRRVFAYHGQFLLTLFGIYFFYQLVSVAAASWAVDSLVTAQGIAAALAKGLILPATFLANYLFMEWLTRRSPSP